MPYHEVEADDPLEGIGVSVPADAEAVREMAYTYAEEFVQLGHGADRVLALFQDPHYGIAHAAWRELGEAEVRRIITECTAVFGRVRVIDRE